MLEVDHVFILTEPGAPAASLLVDAGFIEGSPNMHPGQGTANRRFFFRNLMLELLYINDAEESRASPLALYERSRTPGACPFGVILRSRDAHAPFPAWEYRPDYLPSGTSIFVANDSPLSEPAWFYMPGHRRSNWNVNPNDVTLRIITPKPWSSPAAAAVRSCAELRHHVKPEYLIEMYLGGDQAVDFRPSLPLLLSR